MARVKLNRRWGTNKAGATVDVDDRTADWLRGIGYAGPVADAAAPGADGPDPVISGDPTRRAMRTVKRDKADGENTAAPVEGSLPAMRPGYRGETRDDARPARRSRRATSSDTTSGDSDSGRHRKTGDSK